MTMLEDPDRRRNDTKANDMEGKNSQEDQNWRKTVVTGFHDDTTTPEVQDTLKEIMDHRNVNGTYSDQVSKKADHTCILAIHRQ